VCGVHVQRVVNKASNQEHVNVIHQLQSTAERYVMERHSKVKCAIRGCHAQVSLNSKLLHKVIFKIYYLSLMCLINVDELHTCLRLLFKYFDMLIDCAFFLLQFLRVYPK